MVLTIVTLLLFVVLVFVAGFVSKLLLMAYVYFNPPDEEIPPPADQPPENMEPLDYWDRMLQFDPRNMSLLRFDASHFFAGFFLVGVVGAANVVFQIFLGPFAPMPRFGGVVRVGGGGGGGQDSKFPSLVMLVVVVIGAVRTAYALYKSVKAFSRRGLEVVEASILEVRE